MIASAESQKSSQSWTLCKKLSRSSPSLICDFFYGNADLFTLNVLELFCPAIIQTGLEEPIVKIISDAREGHHVLQQFVTYKLNEGCRNIIDCPGFTLFTFDCDFYNFYYDHLKVNFQILQDVITVPYVPSYN